MNPTSQESQLVLLLDDDLIVTEALAVGLEREARTVVTCNDLESAQLIVERLQPSHVVADVRLSGPFGFEGLDFIPYVKRHSPESRVILISGDAPEALQLEASNRGAVAFLQKPFEITELDAVLDLMSCSVLSSASIEAPVLRMPLLDEILGSGALLPFFQPIVTLDGERQHFGYESLARYRNNSLLRNPEFLFQYAARKQRIGDLELACVAATLHAAAKLGPETSLFLNIHPHVLSQGHELRDVLLRHSELSGVGLERIVLEITEQGSLNYSRSLFDCIDQLRSLGLRFALDDVGVAYSHLPFIDKVRPSFLKISQHFGTAFEADPTKTKIVANLLLLARDFGCELILEGIEQASTANAAEDMKIRYGQGYLFGHPTEASAWSAENQYQARRS